jgi:hypothetical protein
MINASHIHGYTLTEITIVQKVEVKRSKERRLELIDDNITAKKETIILVMIILLPLITTIT